MTTDPKNIAQLARKKLYSNLLAKLNAGKTLTANERQTFDELNAVFDTEGTQGARGGVILETQHLEKLFRVTRETIAQWTKAGMPKVAYGKYDLFACMDWWHENVNARDDDESTSRIKGRYWRAKAEKAEVEVAQAKARLISRADVIDQWCARAAEMKQSLLGWSTRLPPRIEGRALSEIRDIIDEEARKLLESYARDGVYTESAAKPESEEKPCRKRSKKQSGRRKSAKSTARRKG